MGDVTKEQRERIAKKLADCEKTLLRVYSTIKSEDEVKKCSKEEFSRLAKQLVGSYKEFDHIVTQFNKLDSEELPFSLFKCDDLQWMRDLQLSDLAQTHMLLLAIPISNLEETEGYRFYRSLLTKTWYLINYFKFLQKMTLTGPVVEKFYIKPFLSEFIAKSPFSSPNKCLTLDAILEDYTIGMDKDALRWITSLLLLNAENSLVEKEGPGKIVLETIQRFDLKFYLWVSSNGVKMGRDSSGHAFLYCKYFLPKVLTSFGESLRIGEHKIVCTLPVAKNTVSDEQWTHIKKEFEALERILKYFYGALKDPNKLEKYSLSFYEKLSKTAIELYERSQRLSFYISAINSDELPFNLFQGPPQLANHTINRIVSMMTHEIQTISVYFFHGATGARLDNTEIKKRKEEDSFSINHELILTNIKYSINCLKTFRKIATQGYVPERFNIKPFLEKVAADRLKLRHHEYAEPNVNVEDAVVEFDRTALYWIVMRMLSNAERSTRELGKAGKIELLTARKDGKFYLVVRNNGQTIAERAKEAAERGGGKSLPNILKMCKELDANFLVRDSKSKEFTVTACLRLPLAKEQHGLVDKWAK